MGITQRKNKVVYPYPRNERNMYNDPRTQHVACPNCKSLLTLPAIWVKSKCSCGETIRANAEGDKRTRLNITPPISLSSGGSTRQSLTQ